MIIPYNPAVCYDSAVASKTSPSAVKELRAAADPVRAKLCQRYFKTGPGEYGAGDIFMGITVPVQRKIARRYQELGLKELAKLISSDLHECRFTALVILVSQYERAPEAERAKIVAFYLKNRKHVNNWDLVDTSAPYILGDWLMDKDRSILYTLVNSKTIWDRRIAVLATFMFIEKGDFKDSLRLAYLLMNDRHDLMHKAVGWMLREVGKKSRPTLEKFLCVHAGHMPRTMLRYAIERLPDKKRREYLSVKVV